MGNQQCHTYVTRGSERVKTNQTLVRSQLAVSSFKYNIYICPQSFRTCYVRTILWRLHLSIWTNTIFV